MALIQEGLIALVVGALIFVVSRDAAFRTFRGSHIVRYRGERTLRAIQGVHNAIEAYRQQAGKLPESLVNLQPSGDGFFRTDDAGVPVDGWRRQLHYSVDADACRVTSYGRDGKPGGVGLDYDLSTANLSASPAALHGEDAWPALPERALPTFEQFVSDRGEFGAAGSGSMMFVTSIVTGAAAFVVAFIAMMRSRTAGSLIVSLVVTTGGALLIGILLTSLHAPTGH